MLYWVLFLFILLVAATWLFLKPLNIAGLVSRPHPVVSYPEALQRLKVMYDAEEKLGSVNPVCKTRLLSHGEQTEQVIVLLHGYTTCPEQFQALAERFFDLGYNVLLPRMPYHGMTDRLTDELQKLTAEDMAQLGDWAVDVARGLGKKVSVMGISGGGTITAWLAQNRADVDNAFPLAPFLGVAFIPAPLTTLFARLLLTLPNFYSWWDPRYKEKNPYSVFYAYPRYSFHALAETLRLGIAVQQQAEQKPPAAGCIVMVLNRTDPGVNNSLLERLFSTWKKQGKRELDIYRFEKEMKMPHDIITPGTPGVPIEVVYERLVDLAHKETADVQA